MFLGLTIVQWIALAPRIVALVKFFVALVIGYSTLNNVDPATAAIDILEGIKTKIPKPVPFKEWNKEQLQNWFDSAGGNRDSTFGG